jgi:5S rRNA maturation endonuclease (ribonuclease M5)
MIPNGYHRPRKGERCPVCSKPDWCLLSNDGATVICSRATSPRPYGQAGWLHSLDGSPLPTAESFIPAPRESSQFIDCPAILQRCIVDTPAAKRDALAASLGVSGESLHRLGAVWSKRHDAWAFPMSDGERIVGIRLRNAAGKKWAVTGSKQGLFIPADLSGTGPLLICEGPTDTAALLTLGFDAIGRPSCRGGENQIARLLKPYPEIVIVADRDGPGLDGAKLLAERLWKPCKIIAPPRHKDARAWVQAGAKRASVEAVIAAARFRKRDQAA